MPQNNSRGGHHSLTQLCAGCCWCWPEHTNSSHIKKCQVVLLQVVPHSGSHEMTFVSLMTNPWPTTLAHGVADILCYLETLPDFGGELTPKTSSYRSLWSYLLWGAQGRHTMSLGDNRKLLVVGKGLRWLHMVHLHLFFFHILQPPSWPSSK